MSDLISRAEAIKAIDAWDQQDLYLPIHFKQVLEELPSAQQWIPCSERMPKYEEKVLVCYCGQVRIGYLTDISKNSMWTLQGGSFPIFPIKHDSGKFVAWMELPEPPEAEK